MHAVGMLSCQAWPVLSQHDVWRKDFAPLIPTGSSERAGIVQLGKKGTYVMGRSAEDGARLCSVPRDSKRGSGHELKFGKFHLKCFLLLSWSKIATGDLERL